MQALACSDLVDLAIANPGPVALHNLCIFGEISRWGMVGAGRDSFPVIASEAKQSRLSPPRRLDCSVATLLAMTTWHNSAFPRRDSARGLRYSRPSQIRGRRECRVPNAPAALRAKMAGSTHASRDRYAGHSGIPCAMVYDL